MPKNVPDETPEPNDPAADDLGYDAPPELTDEPAAGGPGSPRGLALKLAAVAGIALVVGGGLLAYRAHHRRKVVEAALAQADALLRLDTAAGYRQAATLLEPIAQLDTMNGASVRAFALAMLFADYRQADAEADIENLLVAPMRAENVPMHAQLAAAALALGRREAGTASTAATRAGTGPWTLVLQARVALSAGNPEAALQPSAAAAAEGSFAPGLALHGDVLRRLRKDAGAARAAYEAALAASPAHARAAYGLAKLALAGDAPAAEAETALRRLLDDREGTPPVERARAAVHLAALRLRAGDQTCRRRGPRCRGRRRRGADLGGARRRRRRRTPRPLPRRVGRAAASAERERRRPRRALARAAPPPPPPPAVVKKVEKKKIGPAKKADAKKKGTATKKAPKKADKKKTAKKSRP